MHALRSRVPQLLAIALVVLLGAAQAWMYRHTQNYDGMSYLDMADAILRDGPRGSVNGYWSAAYPALIALVFGLAKPTGAMELPLVHVLNFAIFLWAGWCFSRLHRSLRDLHDARYRSAFELLAIAIFAWVSLKVISLRHVTPDLLLASFVFLVFAILVRGWANAEHAGRRATLELGVVLAIAALTKSVFFVVGALVLVTWFLIVLRHSPRRTAVTHVLLSAALFAAITSPMVVALSVQRGRPTFGENGRLNYLWYVDGVHDHWTGDENVGVPAHPVRRIHESPRVYEFATPLVATYPPWYDASYWYEGASPRIKPGSQLKVFASSLHWYVDWFGPFLALLMLVALLVRARVLLPARDGYWVLALPAVGVFLLFGLVYTEPRHVGAFLAPALLASLGTLRTDVEDTRVLRGIVVVTIALCTFLTLDAVATGALATRADATRGASVQNAIAEELTRVGLRAGERVGVVGNGGVAFWARVARVRIGSEVLDRDAFWASSAAARAEALESMRRAGAVHIIASEVPPRVDTNGWSPLGTTGSYVYRGVGAGVITDSTTR